MTALTIGDVSEDAVRTMKIRAAQAGQSLQAYLRSLIEREVISALLRLIRRQQISEREAGAALFNYRAFPVQRQDVLPMVASTE